MAGKEKTSTGDTYNPGVTEKEAQGVSRNVSLHSFPASYRITPPSQYEEVSHEAKTYNPYRGQMWHGVPTPVEPGNTESGLVDVPPDSKVVGYEAQDSTELFPNPIPVSVVEVPQQTNRQIFSRVGQVRMPPREGADGVPIVQDLLSRELQRVRTWFATDRHAEDDQDVYAPALPLTPYCSHITFNRDMGQFVYDAATNTYYSTDGIPLKSDGSMLGPVQHTDPIYGFNTEHFDNTPAGYESYLMNTRYRNKGIQMLGQFSAEEAYSLMTEPTTFRDAIGMVRSDLDKDTFMQMVYANKVRTIHMSIEHTSRVG